jgi:outer membrane protein assembly factor BamB
MTKPVPKSNEIDLGLPLPPTAPSIKGTKTDVVDSGLLTFSRMAAGARGSFSPLDVKGPQYDSITSLKRMGRAIISNPSGFGGFNEPCIACDLSGTDPMVIVGQFKCECPSKKYATRSGPFGLLWGQHILDGSGTSPALSLDGRLLYVACFLGIYAMDTTTGNVIWTFSNPFADDNFFYSNITVGPDGTVYVGGSGNSYFFAIDGLRGRLRWHYTTGNGDNYFAGAAAVNAAGTIIYTTVNGVDAGVLSFNRSGDLLNRYTNLDLVDTYSVQSPAVASDGTVYISYDENLVALTDDLTLKWTVPCGTITGEYSVSWYKPVIGPDGSIYVGSDPDTAKIYCFIDSGSAATLKWTYDGAANSFLPSPVFGPQGQVYFAQNTYINSSPSPPSSINQSSILSVNPSDGSLIWIYNYRGTGAADYYNFLYPTVGGNRKIYITNIVDSSLFILKDLGSNFAFYKEVPLSYADSTEYGSACLSPPVIGNGGTVFWCNGNINLPSVFGAGYPTLTDIFELPVAPVFRPHIRVGAAVVPAATSNTLMALQMRNKMGAR